MSLRAEFEAFYRDHMRHDECERVEVIESTIDSYNEERDRYGYSDIQELWLSWKASRESLCIHLPETECGGEGYYYDDGLARGHNELLSVIADKLKEAGVTYK